MELNNAGKSILKTYDGVDQILETVITIPPDGGWAWVVMVSSFFCNLIADGLTYTFGMYIRPISKTYGSTSVSVSNVNSLMTGMYSLTGPFASALTNRYGFRFTAILGGFVAGIAFLLTSQTNKLWQCFLSYGILCGIGSGLVYVPSILVVGFYFERWRGLATSISVTGSSVGMIVFPIVTQYILDEYPWTIHFMVFATLFVLCTIFAITFKPLDPVILEPAADTKVTFDLADGPSNFTKYNNAVYPTNADVYPDTAGILSTTSRRVPSSETLYSAGAISGRSSENSRMWSLNIFMGRLRDRSEGNSITFYHVFSSLCCCDCCTSELRAKPIARPLYRDDAFYMGSLKTLPDYQRSEVSRRNTLDNQEKSAVDYHMSVTRVGTQYDIYSGHPICSCCPESCKRVLVTMFDFGILKSSIAISLVILSGFFTSLGMYVPFIHIVERACDNGIEIYKAKLLISVMGLANAFGRLTCGILSTVQCFDTCILSAILLSLSGISTILSSLSYEFWYQSLYSAIFGFTISALASLRSVVIVDLIGLTSLTNAFGLHLVFQGIGSCIGLPLANLILTTTGSLVNSFYFGGGAVLLSGLLLFPVKFFKKKTRVQFEL